MLAAIDSTTLQRRPLDRAERDHRRFALVAHHDPWMRLQLADIALEHGFGIIPVSNGHAALRLAIANRPAVVILAQRLPELSGREVALQLAQAPETRGLAVTLLESERGETLDRAGVIMHLVSVNTLLSLRERQPEPMRLPAQDDPVSLEPASADVSRWFATAGPRAVR